MKYKTLEYKTLKYWFDNLKNDNDSNTTLMSELKKFDMMFDLEVVPDDSLINSFQDFLIDLCAGAFGVLMPAKPTKNDESKKYPTDVKKYNTLSESYDTLSESYDTLSESYDTLSESYDTLSMSYNTLSMSYNTLLMSYNKTACKDKVNGTHQGVIREILYRFSHGSFKYTMNALREEKWEEKWGKEIENSRKIKAVVLEFRLHLAEKMKKGGSKEYLNKLKNRFEAISELHTKFGNKLTLDKEDLDAAKTALTTCLSNQPDWSERPFLQKLTDVLSFGFKAVYRFFTSKEKELKEKLDQSLKPH